MHANTGYKTTLCGAHKLDLYCVAPRDKKLAASPNRGELENGRRLLLALRKQESVHGRASIGWQCLELPPRAHLRQTPALASSRGALNTCECDAQRAKLLGLSCSQLAFPRVTGARSGAPAQVQESSPRVNHSKELGWRRRLVAAASEASVHDPVGPRVKVDRDDNRRTRRTGNRNNV
mmetsp:Transcript_5000/g.14231  ORF Transcript_5000/g.14231 Transcript_5000/m.14231 type:complete len:178 (+) Transcript_5000:575-1108(+)